MDEPHILIKTQGTETHIFVDGNEIHGVRGFKFYTDKRGTPRLFLDLVGTDVTVDTKRIPKIPDIYKPFYVSLSRLVNEGVITEKQAELL